MIHHYINFDFDFFRVLLGDKVILSKALQEANPANTAKVMRLATEHANWLDGYCETKWIDGTWELTFYKPDTATAPKYIPEPVRGNSK